MEAKTAETMKGLAVTTIRSIRQKVASLSGGQRQSVAVARAVMWNSRLVILDEPTAALGVAQTRQVLELVKRLAEQGLAVVIISHNLHDVFEVATRITVLRLGRSIAVYDRDDDDPAGGRPRDHGRRARRRSPASPRRPTIPSPPPQRDRGMTVDVSTSCGCRRSPADGNGVVAHVGRWFDSVRAGDVGSLPIIVGLLLITVFFQTKNANFLTAGNISNLIVQMSGTTTIAMGVVFVLLLGEIDLSIGFVSGIAGVVVAELQVGGRWTVIPGWAAIIVAVLVCAGIGLIEGSFVAFVGVPSFIVTLAFLLALQGVIQKLIGVTGVIVIQDKTIFNVANYFLPTSGGWIAAAVAHRPLRLQHALRRRQPPAPRHPLRQPRPRRDQARVRRSARSSASSGG